jgi:hypothetical protein
VKKRKVENKPWQGPCLPGGQHLRAFSSTFRRSAVNVAASPDGLTAGAAYSPYSFSRL